jgi:glycosyltransferase involved in cell wall biosynthesis
VQDTESKAEHRVTPEVVILLGIHNGAPWLRAQLDSFASQQGVRWRLIASDDRSSDDSAKIIQAFAADHPGHAIKLVPGPGQGAAQNFLHLLRQVPPGTAFAALSDQDDVWLPSKLARATERLAALPAERPALYCGRTVICDESLRRLGLSPLFTRPPSFRNALTQSIGGGNTMVLNRAAIALARAAAAEAGAIVMHDWWLYQLVSGAGGSVIYDPEPQILYRQHGRNQIGSNDSAGARLRRLRMVARGTLRDWNATNIAALRTSAHRLTAENHTLLEDFAEARAAPFPGRLLAFRRLGLYRQTRGGELTYWCAAAAGLI